MSIAIRVFVLTSLAFAGAAQAHPGHALSEFLHVPALPAGACFVLGMIGLLAVPFLTRKPGHAQLRSDD